MDLKIHHSHIAGAGIAGVAAAIAFAKNDIGVTVLEQAHEFSEIGAGLQLGPNAVKALQSLGAWDAVAARAYSPPEINVRDGRSGKILKSIALGESFVKRFGVPYRVIHRADLHRALLEVLQAHKNVELLTDRKVSLAEHSGRDVKIRFENGDHLYAEWLLGADGIESKIRQILFPKSAAVSLPCIVLRNMAQRPIQSEINWDAVNLWLCPRGHVVHYPIGDRINVVIVNDAAGYEGWYEPLREFLNHQSGYTNWSAKFVNPLTKWHKGFIGLIGDAAHGTVPYLAQGAAQSLEDAACLARTPDFTKLYEYRASKAAMVHRASLTAGTAYHATGLAAAARNLLLSHMSEQIFLNRLGKVYGS